MTLGYMDIARTNASVPTVLIVEDEKIVAKDLQQTLIEFGYRVSGIAASAKEAVTLSAVTRPDIVVMDIRIKGDADGIETADRLKNLFGCDVIYLTAYSDVFSLNRAKRTNPVGYLTKPVKTADLRSLIEITAFKRDLQATRETARRLEEINRLANLEVLSTNARMALLTELIIRFASERDLAALRTAICDGARALADAHFVVLAVTEPNDPNTLVVTTSGVDPGVCLSTPPLPSRDPGPLGTVCSRREIWHGSDSPLPADFPAADAFVAVPIAGTANVYGWLCFAYRGVTKKITREDERLLSIFGSQAGRAYENNQLHHEVQQHALMLQDAIDRREAADAALRFSEARFRGVFNNASLGIAIVGSDRRLRQANSAYCRILGHDAAELTDLDAALPVCAEDREIYRDALNLVLAGEQDSTVIEVRHLHKNGRVLWVRVSLSPQLNEQNKPIGVITIYEDVTERKQIDSQLRLLQSAVDRLNDVILITDAQQTENGGPHIVYVNDAFTRMTGFERSEALGNTPRMLQGPKTDRSELDRIHLALWNEKSVTARLINYTKDGRQFCNEIEITPIFDAQARPAHFVAIERDVTESIALETQVRQLQRMDAIGHLTGGIAHDFNNLLTVILGSAELLCEAVAEHEIASDLAHTINMAADRGAKLTHRLLSFARQQALTPQVVDVNTLLLGMSDLLQRTLREHIEIRWKLVEKPWPVAIDPALFESAVLNLCINARDAMPDGGCLTIETGNVYFETGHASKEIDIKAGEYLLLVVSDTGFGIAPEHLDRVYDPFFTTKEPGSGTGLGLSMVYGFIRQSGGRIDLNSAVGLGTNLRIYLPRVAADNASDVAPEATACVIGGFERVLLVEDDLMVRKYASTQLASLGYQVVAANDANKALAQLKEAGNFDILFTDMVMPGGMSGRQLADAARRFVPGLKVLYTSGYDQTAMDDERLSSDTVTLLPKPYSRRDLAQKVREALATDCCVAEAMPQKPFSIAQLLQMPPSTRD